MYEHTVYIVCAHVRMLAYLCAYARVYIYIYIYIYICVCACVRVCVRVCVCVLAVDNYTLTNARPCPNSSSNSLLFYLLPVFILKYAHLYIVICNNNNN